jgi:hypothetical protein
MGLTGKAGIEHPFIEISDVLDRTMECAIFVCRVYEALVFLLVGR